jgi:uncharacterized membrane protein (UPF0127 family)
MSVFVFLLLAPMTGCKRPAAKPTGPINQNLPTTTIQIGNEQFTLEIASTDPTRQIGLMNRHSMPANHGMIFVFPREEPLGFWMKSTYIPLDILYLSEGGRVVSIRSMKPLDLTSVPSGYPAKYAIELNQGAATRAGVRVGDQLTIPPEAQQPR